jgi:hypothetical protein
MTRPLRLARPALALLSLAGAASAQVVNPADAQQKPESQQPAQHQAPAPRLRSWEMEPTVVSAERLSNLREEDPIGDYGQPRWTAHRRFPTTRVYVVPAGKVEVEHWTRVKVPEKGPSTVETQYEIEFGLPGRIQIDLYAVTEKTGSEGELDWSEHKYEVRYALADWGEIWGNPTLYAEWVESNGGPDKIEAKLLLGGEVTEGWHWGSNLVYEHEVSGELESEYELTLGLSHTIRDEKLSLGGEMKAALTDVHDDRGDFDESLEIGPSLQWRPLPPMHVDIATLFGVTDDSRDADIFVVLGWEF